MSSKKRPRLVDRGDCVERPSKRLIFENSFHPFFFSIAKLLTFNTTQSAGTVDFHGYPGLSHSPFQRPRYPDRYRPAYARRPPTYSHRKPPSVPSLVRLTIKLSNVLDAEGIPIQLLGYRDNPRNLPPYLHTILCMQEDYINSKVNRDEAYFRMLETSKGRSEMKKQARLQIETTLDYRLSKGRSERSWASHNPCVFKYTSVKVESPSHASFDQAKTGFGGSRVLPSSDVSKNHL